LTGNTGFLAQFGLRRDARKKVNCSDHDCGTGIAAESGAHFDAHSAGGARLVRGHREGEAPAEPFCAEGTNLSHRAPGANRSP